VSRGDQIESVVNENDGHEDGSRLDDLWMVVLFGLQRANGERQEKMLPAD